MIPVSVIVTTRNEEQQLERCLIALKNFSEVFVVDSASTDATCVIAAKLGARVERFAWNGKYPKKRQWCLDNLELRHDWVFFVDADEEVTADIVREIAALFEKEPQSAGYFVRGRYVLDGKALRFGLQNNKLVLFDRRRVAFPEVDDLDCPGMGEMEGHYQPVPQDGGAIGQLKHAMLHYAYDERWEERHKRYAAWERAMNAKRAWPADPVPARQALKTIFRSVPGRGLAAFLHCYIGKGGVLDGRKGFWFALSRYRYYRMIAAA